MKYIKMLGLLAIAAAALMAFAGTASATTLTSPKGTTYTGTIHATSELGHVILHASNGVTIECASTVTGTVEKHGSGITAGGNLSTLDFTGCTGGDVVTVNKKGSLEIHGEGTLTSSGAEVKAVDGATGIECIFSTTSTDVGLLTDSSVTGGHATLDINSAKIPRTGGSILCGSTATWTGFYTVTTPTTLYVDP